MIAFLLSLLAALPFVGVLAVVAPTSSEKVDPDAFLAEWALSCAEDPLKFVLEGFPWGEPGPLEHHAGPDTWQREALESIGEQVRARKFNGRDAVQPIRIAVSSGHGIGKSTIQAWLVLWLMSTRPGCRGTITANTATQLDTKTWAAIQTWHKRCVTADWFECNTTRLYRKGERENWFCAPQSCKEENSEAFAGQHAADSTSFYVVDEGSAVPDKIYEVAEGGLTDGEPFIFVFGNCTRSQGKFYRICFGADRNYWHPIIVDSRQSRFTNKQQIAEWEAQHGEESDFFRVRVRGLPPAASDLQFISTALVRAAQQRQSRALPDDALVAGLDVARGGNDNNVIWFRRGVDARSVPPIVVPGEQTRDSMRLVTLAADLLGREIDCGDGTRKRLDMLFIDGTGIGGPIYDRLVQLGHGKRVTEVQFGAVAPEDTSGQKYANMRAFMWGKGREWLNRGMIPEDPQLETDLTGPGYSHDKHDRIVLESKEHMKARGLDSPDRGDGLFLTFAAVVISRQPAASSDDYGDSGGSDGWLG
jgi:hypothetical protein